MKNGFFWNVTILGPINGYRRFGDMQSKNSALLDAEDEGATIVRDAGNNFPVDRAQQLRKPFIFTT